MRSVARWPAASGGHAPARPAGLPGTALRAGRACARRRGSSARRPTRRARSRNALPPCEAAPILFPPGQSPCLPNRTRQVRSSPARPFRARQVMKKGLRSRAPPPDASARGACAPGPCASGTGRTPRDFPGPSSPGAHCPDGRFALHVQRRNVAGADVGTAGPLGPSCRRWASPPTRLPERAGYRRVPAPPKLPDCGTGPGVVWSNPYPPDRFPPPPARNRHPEKP